MKRQLVLRMTESQHKNLRSALNMSDGRESVAVALCGVAQHAHRVTQLLREVHPVPADAYEERSPVSVHWKTDFLLPLLDRAVREGLSLLKIHSHPGGYSEFSEADDQSDRKLLPSVYGWVDNSVLHASAVLLPDGSMFGRAVHADGSFWPFSRVSVVGDDLTFWERSGPRGTVEAFLQRHAQLFGAGTTVMLGRLRIGVVGCSGTGSILIEQLHRLGVGHLVLVDPDIVEVRNLNRIPQARRRHAELGRFKVDVIAESILEAGLKTSVTAHPTTLATAKAVRDLASCDMVFGCMDGASGRHLLNRLATFYSLPYFDLGVRLDADGAVGIEQMCGTVHYLQPERSSLLTRGVYSLEEVRAEDLQRSDPPAYEEQLRSKYIVGVQEDRPAVISVNSAIASLAVNGFLARLHPFRDDPNHDFAAHRLSISQDQLYREAEQEPCSLLAKHVGRGDVLPLLHRTDISEEHESDLVDDASVGSRALAANR